MRYVILACSNDTEMKGYKVPRQLSVINGEPIIERTIRLLKENGVKDIVVSARDKRFDYLGIKHEPRNNNFDYTTEKGYWLDAFPYEFLNEPVCFIWGDVYFSEQAIKTIVETETESTLFFCSHLNRSIRYIKKHDEPFAYKVVDTDLFRTHRDRVKKLFDEGKTERHPIVWELYRSINGIDVNKHKLTNNVVIINDITCDIDNLQDVYRLRLKVGGNMVRVKCRNVDFTYSNFDKVKELIRANSQISEPGHIYPNDTFLVSDSEAKYLTEDAQWVKDNHTPLVDIIEVIPDKKEEVEKKPVKRGRKSAK